MKRTYRPGETAQNSGEARLVRSDGIKLKQEVTVVRGKTLPPTPRPGMSYYLGDLTKHTGR